jgi:hypothetical protein
MFDFVKILPAVAAVVGIAIVGYLVLRMFFGRK